MIKVSYSGQMWVPSVKGSDSQASDRLWIKCISINVCAQRSAYKCFTTGFPKTKWEKA